MQSWDIALLSPVLSLYILAMLAYWAHFIGRGRGMAYVGAGLLAVGVALHTAGLVSRGMVAHRVPLTNQYEYTTGFAWAAVIAYLVAEGITGLSQLGAFVTPVVVGLMAYARAAGGPVESLMPALQNPFWLTVHIATGVISYGLLAISCAAAIAYLAGKDKEAPATVGLRGFLQQRLPSRAVLDNVIYKSVGYAFPWLTLLIITGAIWAQTAWSRYWGWDPKEVASLVTWLVYAVYLHCRITQLWTGRRAAIMAIVGFVFVLFTFFGVNLVLPGLHSYA